VLNLYFRYRTREILSLHLPYHNKEEKELALLISEGDEMAFKQLYNALLPYLAGSGIKILKSEDAVAEVIQETLVRVWVHREKLRQVNYPRAWIYRVFSNECFRYLKKYGLLHIPLEAVAEMELDAVVNNAELAYSMKETKEIIHHVVTSLSPRQRQIYQLSREQGLKIPEIAAELGLASKYVKKTLMVALHIIRRQLIKAGKLYFLLVIFLSSG
jgi:RNA polymerase sigma factor (sigma-70 family)